MPTMFPKFISTFSFVPSVSQFSLRIYSAYAFYWTLMTQIACSKKLPITKFVVTGVLNITAPHMFWGSPIFYGCFI